ncbi:MAG: hypothetical protein NTY19_16240 [Planctomycetota bacterium]|nr:hypothetical protein [Planctomycetota bacterium]
MMFNDPTVQLPSMTENTSFEGQGDVPEGLSGIGGLRVIQEETRDPMAGVYAACLLPMRLGNGVEGHVFFVDQAIGGFEVGPGVFSLSDSALNWCFPECLILFHSGLPRGAITKSRMTEWPLGHPCS